jgi:hypothetical protein
MLGSEDTSDKSDRYLDIVKAIQSKYRRRPQFGSMGGQDRTKED